MPNGISYGPAVSRITRTPITFGNINDDPQQSGNFEQPNIATQLLNLIPALRQKIGQGSIQINPYSADNINTGTSIKHEEIHALLNNLNFTGKMEELAKNNPYYKQVASKLAGRGGDPTLETPAYMGAFDSSQTPAPQQDRDNYVTYLGKQLVKIDPDMAAKFARLSK